LFLFIASLSLRSVALVVLVTFLRMWSYETTICITRHLWKDTGTMTSHYIYTIYIRHLQPLLDILGLACGKIHYPEFSSHVSRDRQQRMLIMTTLYTTVLRDADAPYFPPFQHLTTLVVILHHLLTDLSSFALYVFSFLLCSSPIFHNFNYL